jgi:hypothetical protein
MAATDRETADDDPTVRLATVAENLQELWFGLAAHKNFGLFADFCGRRAKSTLFCRF